MLIKNHINVYKYHINVYKKCISHYYEKLNFYLVLKINVASIDDTHLEHFRNPIVHNIPDVKQNFCKSLQY